MEPPEHPRRADGSFIDWDDELYEAAYEEFGRAHAAWGATATEIAAHPDAARFADEDAESLREELMLAYEDDEREREEIERAHEAKMRADEAIERAYKANIHAREAIERALAGGAAW